MLLKREPMTPLVSNANNTVENRIISGSMAQHPRLAGSLARRDCLEWGYLA
jgi:hypothetical protein